jgi:ATP-binding cassette subfamily F protein 3
MRCYHVSMGVIRLQNVTKQFGGQIVLGNLSLDLHTNEIAALIGGNGVGKTTLFRLIAGQLPPDTGTVTVSKGLQIGYLPQEPDLRAGGTLREAVADAFADLMALERKLQDLSHRIADAHDSDALPELMAQYDRQRARFEASGGYAFEQRLDEILGGLGFSPGDLSLPISALSGGQKCRAALGKLLLQERQFLLLDEPTNHLDIDAVRWLEKFLAGHHGGAVIISHDRYLLDRLAQRTIELVPTQAGGRLYTYTGNYSDFVRTRELRELTQRRQYEQDQAYIRKEQAFITRHIAGQRRNQAVGRRKRLERRIEAGEFVMDKPTEREGLKIRFDASEKRGRTGREILGVEGITKRYGEKSLFADLSLAVRAGERLGITGPNGTGKTTLFRILLEQVKPDTGQVRVAQNIRIGYFAQEPEDLDPDRTVIQEIQTVRPDFLERDARHYAARFLFTDEDPFKRAGSLSGGEQSRLRFMKLILAAPDVLILDEPTNHLDIPSREALETALAEFPGTVLAVSHDRYFLDRIAEKLLVMRIGEQKLYAGNYSYYIEQVEAAKAERQAAEAAGGGRGRGGRTVRRTARKPAETPRSPLHKLKLPELEAYIAEREERMAAFEARFGDPEVYKDAERITQLRAEFEAIRAELAEAEAVWLKRAEEA